jgi:hypothetical protein
MESLMGSTSNSIGNNQPDSIQSTETARVAPVNSSQSPSRLPFRLIVKEFVPRFIEQTAPPRTTIVDRLDQVLTIPWISRLPGDKELTRSRGQRVVVQHYLGYHLVRAHVHWDYKLAR